ncbi:MAG: hypothetical protein DMD59_13450 [Gemmatimonadetes bacterium]|nr:MAG: hypothetical protein DMD59_13450 [Gemmatimonadota bacterium]
MLLWLFIIFLGIAFGAGLYESRVVVPMWTSDPPASLASPDSGHRFWAFVTTGPLTLLTVANLVAALQTQGPARAWWLTAAIVTLVERAATFGYFIPTIIRLQRTPTLTQTAVRTALARWVRLNYVRNTLTLVAWIAALKVLAKL